MNQDLKNISPTLGKVVLIPVPLAAGALHTLSIASAEVCKPIQHFFVEHVREARRILKQIVPEIVIDQLHFSETNNNTTLDIPLFKSWLAQGHTVGIMSDAGCPGIADPGATLVAIAHQMGAKVEALSGPSSILMALMLSGFNGQNFAFWGYLPIKEPERSKKIKSLESLSQSHNQTQIFIETPYRNQALLQDLIKNCQDTTELCVAQHLCAEDEQVIRKTIKNWKKNQITLLKVPSIFILK